MRETLVVSSRGQITLPAGLRKRMGIQNGDVVILEEHDNKIVLKPGIVLEFERYNDQQIAQWDRDDELPEEERDQIIRTLASPEK